MATCMNKPRALIQRWLYPHPQLKTTPHLNCGISQGPWFYVPSSISKFTKCVDRVHSLLLAASGSRIVVNIPIHQVVMHKKLASSSAQVSEIGTRLLF